MEYRTRDPCTRCMYQLLTEYSSQSCINHIPLQTLTDTNLHSQQVHHINRNQQFRTAPTTSSYRANVIYISVKNSFKSEHYKERYKELNFKRIKKPHKFNLITYYNQNITIYTSYGANTSLQFGKQYHSGYFPKKNVLWSVGRVCNLHSFFLNQMRLLIKKKQDKNSNNFIQMLKVTSGSKILAILKRRK